ncbi:MAG: hypothetical protein NTU41_06355 [Chloroflexi bacterium]|nr:hypothetical protein [Chloroflexota bacterium]
MSVSRLTAVQVGLLAALSGLASYSFYASFGYPYVRDFVVVRPGSADMAVVLVLATVAAGVFFWRTRMWLPAAAWFLILACSAGLVPVAFGLAGLMSLLGVFIVVMKGRQDWFLAPLLVFHLPSLMTFSSADWLWFLPDFAWETRLTFASASALSFFLVAGYLALRYVTRFKESAGDLMSRGYQANQVSVLSGQRLAFTSVTLLKAVAVTGAVFGASVGLERMLGKHVARLPAGVALVGIGASAVLIGVVYWTLSKRRNA